MPQQQELSDQDAVNFLLEPDELSDEQAVAFLTAPDEPQAEDPGAPSPLGAFAGSAMEGLSSLAGGTRLLTEKVPGLGLFLPPRLGEAAGLAEQGLQAGAEEVYPKAQRGRGGLLSDDIPAALGSVAAAAPGGAMGGLAAAATYGAQNGLPLYYDVLEATGDEAKATGALIFGAAVGQLERFGAEKYAAGIIQKLSGGALGKAVKDVAVHAALGAGGEAATEAAQQALSDLAYEHLTGEDLANWERVKAVLGPSAIVGGAFGAVDAALSRRGSVEGNAPEKTPGRPVPEVRPETAPQEQELLPEVPRGVQQAPEGAAPGVEGTPQPAVALQPEHEVQGAQAPAVPDVREPEGLGVSPETRGAEEPGTPEAGGELRTPVGEEAAPAGSAVAVPEAPSPVGEEAQAQPATGIKNRTVAAELEKMGMPLPEKAERESFVQWHAQAVETVKQDADAGRRLVDELADHPRAVDEHEKALLSLEANKRINEREAAEEAFLEEPTEANQARIDRAKAEYKKAADVFDAAGTTAGRALAARKMMVARDESLAAIERSLEVAKGSKLSTKEAARAVELHRELAKTRKAFEAYVADKEKRIASLEAESAALKAPKKLESKSRRLKSISESKAKIDEIINKLASDTKAAAGLDPAKIKLTFELATEHLKLGYQHFAIWADEMVSKIGEHIRPYLKPAWDQAMAEQDAQLLKTYKSRKRTDIARLTERTKAKEFNLKRRETPIHKDPEAIRLKSEYEGAKRKLEHERRKHERVSRSLKEKALDALKEPFHFTRAFITAFDFSAVFRQGGFFSLGHPIQAAKHTLRMFGAAFSAKKALQIDTEIRARPLHAFGDAAGLQLTSLDDGLGPQEEALRSHLSDYVPGIKASNRAYITFLNLQRSAIFDSIIQGLPDKPTLDEGRAIANLVNVGSGRGNPGKFAGAIEAAAIPLWSPRLLLSRFQILLGQPAYKGTAATRKAVAKEYARFLVGVAGLYALAKLAGADVEDDPRSSDFGKIHVKNTRVDPLAGLSQVFVLLSRLLKGETKSSTSGKVSSLRGNRKYGQKSAAEVIGTFLRTKLSPLAGASVDILSGENVVGEKVTPKSLGKSLLIPMTLRDTQDAMKDLGVPAGAAAGVMSAFGMSVQSYARK